MSSFGPVKQAAVLVALFQRKGGDLEVILTTRAKHLRRHPSQTVRLSSLTEAFLAGCLRGLS